MNSKSATIGLDNMTVGIEKAAQIVGLSERRLAELAKNQKVPAAKPGKSWVFVPDDVIGYDGWADEARRLLGG